jgi:hypothetical protein
VGRGGVLDLAVRWTDPQATLVLDTVHRFADEEYAALTLAMRTGADPGRVFDALYARGEIRIHPSDTERTQALTDTATTTGQTGARGRRLVVADTREQVTALNASIRDQLVTAGRVDDTTAVTTAAGVRIGVGDRVATRANDRGLDVANRDTWTVTAITPDPPDSGSDGYPDGGPGGGPGGGLRVTGHRSAGREVPAS